MDHWESVLKDPFAPDSSRCKALGWSSFDWDGPMSGIYSMTSPDGLRWTHTAEPVFHYHPRPGTRDLGLVGDAQSLMIDARERRYVAFLRGHPERGSLGTHIPQAPSAWRRSGSMGSLHWLPVSTVGRSPPGP